MLCACVPAVPLAVLCSVAQFAFLPYQRREANFDSSLGPKTTGTTYFDNLQKPASFTLTTNDPAGGFGRRSGCRCARGQAAACAVTHT